MEEACPDALLLDKFGVSGGDQIDAIVTTAGDSGFKQSGVIADEFPVAARLTGIPADGAALTGFADDHDEAIWLMERQRPKENGVDDAEDGGIDADAKRQGDQDREGKSRALTELACSVAKIVPYVHDGCL